MTDVDIQMEIVKQQDIIAKIEELKSQREKKKLELLAIEEAIEQTVGLLESGDNLKSGLSDDCQ